MKTIPQILDAAKRVTEFIQTQQKTPNYILVDKEQIDPPSFNRMMAATVVELYNKSNRNILELVIKPAKVPQTSLTPGELQLMDYVDVANRANLFSRSNNTWPNFITSKMGNISPDQFMDMYSRILNFYKDKGVLPRFVYTTSVTPLPPVRPAPIPDNLRVFLNESRNCQANNEVIRSLANKLKTAPAMFNHVRDSIGYDYYYNTRFGAVNTTRQRIANCCDQAHLLIALLRSAGIPARYRHVRADYGVNVYGHVYVEAHIGGKWHGLDPSSTRNTFDSINRWKLVSNINTYRELPF